MLPSQSPLVVGEIFSDFCAGKPCALVVGAGVSGATVAERLASAGTRVLVIEARPQIGGNCFDYRDAETGVTVHKYGPHIFHTNNAEVWNYLSRFTQWRRYEHKVLANIDGKLVPVPFNLNSVHSIFPPETAARLEEKLLALLGPDAKTTVLELRGNADAELARLGEFVYEKVFLFYTQKQWGLKPEEIDPAVTARVPILSGRDDCYFHDEFQAIPLGGYTAMIEKMLSAPAISVCLKTPFASVRDRIPEGMPIFFTGAIDEFFDFSLGELPYRSIRFDLETLEQEFFQPAACVNYTCSEAFTRITEYKYFLDEHSPKTVIGREYSSKFDRDRANGRCYPIAQPQNAALYARYVEEAAREFPNVRFLGRLGDYKYYNMDAAVARALAVAKDFLAQPPEN